MTLYSTWQHTRRSLLLVPGLAVLVGFAGCGMGTTVSGDGPAAGTFTLAGMVHGGNQPVTGATIQLYTAGSSGNGSAATAMITSTSVSTTSSGSFSITGDYSCVHTTDQVYLTATGGNPGLSDPTTNNNGLVMLVAIGNCGNLSSNTTQFLFVNEITTVAAVYALAPFISASTSAPYFNIGANSTNSTGLANAFLNAQLLANIGTGAAATLPSGLTTQSGKLYALADAISYCVNSASSASANCAALATAATPSGGTKPPANTLASALSVVRHPGDANIVSAIWGLINSQAPFPTTPLTQAPNDWSMTLTVTGGGLSSPTALGVDSSGNVWVANYTGSLSGFSPQGAAFNSAGYKPINSSTGSSYLGECYGLTIDASGNIWVTNLELPSHSPSAGSVVKFHGANSSTPGTLFTNSANGTPYFYDASIDYPTALTADTNGNIGIANSANSSATIYSGSGTLVSSSLASGNSSDPVAIAFDSSDGLWLANKGDSTVTHISSTGSLLAHPSCCNGANGVATDSMHNAWVTNYYGGYVVALSPTGVTQTLVDGGADGGVSSGYPEGISVDAAQNVWITDNRGTAITELAGVANSLAAGTALSPTKGYGLDASLLLPYSIVPDASGNVWVSNYGNSSVVMFFGLATPTVTPVQPVPAAP